MRIRRRIITGVIGAAALLAITAPPALAGKSVSPGSWNFGTWPIGSTATPKTFTLTVTCIPSMDGVIPCQFNDFLNPLISTTGDYAVFSEDCPLNMMAGPPPLSPSQSCSITVNFGPTAGGTRSGTLETGGPSAALTGFAPLPVAAPTPTPQVAPKKCKKKHRNAAAAKRCKKRR